MYIRFVKILTIDIIFASQNIIVCFPAMFGTVVLVLSELCFDQKSEQFYRLASEFFGVLTFSSGFGTVLQATFGNR